MSSFLSKYKEQVRHQHGWEVELQCPECSHEGLPMYNGWTPSSAVNSGNTPMIYVDLTCSECGHELKSVAGTKLTELFTDVSIPARNKGLIYAFIVSVGLPLVFAGLIWAGASAGWWGRDFLWLALLPILFSPLIFFWSNFVASISWTCECGKPSYLLMGMLGRSYCYRCSSCGTLLRMRD